MRFWLAAAVLLWAGMAPLVAPLEAQAATVSGVRLADHGETTRFVLDISAKPRYHLENQGDRLVIDLPDCVWQVPDRLLRAGSVARVRHAPEGGHLKVILELRSPSAVGHVMILAPAENYPYRLVFDLIPAPKTRRPPPVAAIAPRHAPPPPEEAPRQRIIAIDPGHGGVDPGTIGADGAFEKNITLPMAKALARALAADGRYRAFLTRDRDVFVPLRERVARARAVHADLFLSLHADAIAGSDMHGATIYTLSDSASDTEAAALAAKENKADIVAGMDLSNQHPEVANILIELAQRDTMNRSSALAALLVKNVAEVGPVIARSHRFAGFAVLKAPDIPSALIEMGYLSNPGDEKRLQQPKYRAKFATAIVRSIDSFFAPANNRDAKEPRVVGAQAVP